MSFFKFIEKCMRNFLSSVFDDKEILLQIF